jgi:hypothetical protein
MNESQLVILLPLAGLLYVREGETPENGYKVAFTVNEDGSLGREWFLYFDFVDGVELAPTGDSPLVRADSIALNRPTVPFDPSSARRLTTKPQRLADRWRQYHCRHPRVITPSLWQRFRRWRTNGQF